MDLDSSGWSRHITVEEDTTYLIHEVQKGYHTNIRKFKLSVRVLDDQWLSAIRRFYLPTSDRAAATVPENDNYE